MIDSILAGCVMQSYGDNEESVDKELLGKKIKQERLRCNFSLSQLSEKLGINPGKLSRIEHGREKLSALQMESIASALGVTVEELRKPPERGVTYVSLQKVRRGQYPGRPPRKGR